jgi:hypothetical protein
MTKIDYPSDPDILFAMDTTQRVDVAGKSGPSRIFQSGVANVECLDLTPMPPMPDPNASQCLRLAIVSRFSSFPINIHVFASIFLYNAAGAPVIHAETIATFHKFGCGPGAALYRSVKTYDKFAEIFSI